MRSAINVKLISSQCIFGDENKLQGIIMHQIWEDLKLPSTLYEEVQNDRKNYVIQTEMPSTARERHENILRQDSEQRAWR